MAQTIEKSQKREKAQKKARQGMRVSTGRLEHIGNSRDRRSKNGK